MTVFWQAQADGVSVRAKVQPKSRRPGIQGRAVSAQGACLRIGVSEPAEAGRANRSACAVLAEAVGVATSAVSVVLGQTSRDKTLHIAGDPLPIIAKLETL